LAKIDYTSTIHRTQPQKRNTFTCCFKPNTFHGKFPIFQDFSRVFQDQGILNNITGLEISSFKFKDLEF